MRYPENPYQSISYPQEGESDGKLSGGDGPWCLGPSIWTCCLVRSKDHDLTRQLCMERSSSRAENRDESVIRKSSVDARREACQSPCNVTPTLHDW